MTHTKIILLVVLVVVLQALLFFRVEQGRDKTEEEAAETEIRVTNLEGTSAALLDSQIQDVKDTKRLLRIIDRIIRNQRGLLRLYQQ